MPEIGAIEVVLEAHIYNTKNSFFLNFTNLACLFGN